ncbi:MAG: M48 family metallopeptidase [Euryarchaeota archaeon]|nr:M48 family metallopeptidase [Euryarchaeota archaeon]
MTVSDIVIEVVRKDIKNLHIGVYPPDGRVRVATPLLVDDEAVRLAVISRLEWINRQRYMFQEQERQSVREYISKESHYFQGRRYLLEIINTDREGKVVLKNNTMKLHVPKGSDVSQRERVLLQWYRRELRTSAAPIVEKWSQRLNVDLKEYRIRRMKTKWGSCNPQAKRIWLNLELVKKPLHCLEYIIVHELIHLLERNHNERFQALMDEHMPQWRSYREELNRKPLAHEEWNSD